VRLHRADRSGHIISVSADSTRYTVARLTPSVAAIVLTASPLPCIRRASSSFGLSSALGRPAAKQTKTDKGEIDVRDHYQLIIIEPLTVKVGEDELTIGCQVKGTTSELVLP
jgi:hypothetical protein